MCFPLVYFLLSLYMHRMDIGQLEITAIIYIKMGQFCVVERL